MTGRASSPEAGQRIETSMHRGRPVEKLCAGGCGSHIPKRKKFCGPCYDKRLQDTIAANRHKYRRKP